jgi:hypothetical protein
VTFAVDWFSVVSGCNPRGIEASEALSRGVGLHWADRNYHVLSLQVLFFSDSKFCTGISEMPFGGELA